MASRSLQIISVHVTPRSGRDAVLGVRANADGQLVVQVRVKAAPEGGKANGATCATVAQSIGIAKGNVSVYRGSTARTKLVAIDAAETEVAAWMKTLPTV